jgi:clan AA aspartic protease (TIGR02281 family)
MTQAGSDHSPLPGLFPEASWLALKSPVGSGTVKVEALINGRRVAVILDTGATSTAFSPSLAARVGLRSGPQSGARGRTLNALGEEVASAMGIADKIVLGAFAFHDVPVLLVEDDRDLVLLGHDLLGELDLYLANDQGWVGVFPAGLGPREGADGVVSLRPGDRRSLVELQAKNQEGEWVSFTLVLDTGATSTSLPVVAGLQSNLKTDLRYVNDVQVVGQSAQLRGRFRLEGVRLGKERFEIGPIIAVGDQSRGGETYGLLGTDVTMRHHTVISVPAGQVRFFKGALRASRRMLGPNNAPCLAEEGQEVPCVEVAWQAEAPPCVQVSLHSNYKNRAVELSLLPHDGEGHSLFAGGAIHLFLSPGEMGFSACVGKNAGLERLDIPDGGGISLQWVRAEKAAWPCSPEATHCMLISAPLRQRGDEP